LTSTLKLIGWILLLNSVAMLLVVAFAMAIGVL
jgi:hypothetical protein